MTCWLDIPSWMLKSAATCLGILLDRTKQWTCSLHEYSRMDRIRECRNTTGPEKYLFGKRVLGLLGSMSCFFARIDGRTRECEYEQTPPEFAADCFIPRMCRQPYEGRPLRMAQAYVGLHRQSGRSCWRRADATNWPTRKLSCPESQLLILV